MEEVKSSEAVSIQDYTSKQGTQHVFGLPSEEAVYA